MVTRVQMIEMIQDEFERFVNGHSNTGMSAARVFERIRPHIALDGERITFQPRSTDDPRVGLTFNGQVRVVAQSVADSPDIHMIPGVPQMTIPEG